MKGSRWALSALAAGIAGSTLAIEAARRLRQEALAEEQLRQSTRFRREADVPEPEPAATPTTA